MSFERKGEIGEGLEFRGTGLIAVRVAGFIVIAGVGDTIRTTRSLAA